MGKLPTHAHNVPVSKHLLCLETARELFMEEIGCECMRWDSVIVACDQVQETLHTLIAEFSMAQVCRLVLASTVDGELPPSVVRRIPEAVLDWLDSDTGQQEAPAAARALVYEIDAIGNDGERTLFLDAEQQLQDDGYNLTLHAMLIACYKVIVTPNDPQLAQIVNDCIYEPQLVVEAS